MTLGDRTQRPYLSFEPMSHSSEGWVRQIMIMSCCEMMRVYEVYICLWDVELRDQCRKRIQEDVTSVCYTGFPIEAL